MKNLYKVFVVLLIPVTFYLLTGFLSSGEEKKIDRNTKTITQLTPPPNPSKDFLNIIFNFDWKEYNPGQWISAQLDKIKNELHYNGVQVYGGVGLGGVGNGSGLYGFFDTPLDSYQIQHTKDYMDSIGNPIYNYNLKGIYGRIKIEKPCYGQRLIYEAEGGNNGYSYSSRMNAPIQDGNRTVVKAIYGSNSTGMICENITENLQHSDIIDYLYESKGNWYLKPEIKIKQVDFSPYDDREVVRIEIHNFSDEVIDTKIIRVRNFGDINHNYTEGYIEKYNFIDDPGMNLLISGTDAPGCLNHNRGLIGNPFENDRFKNSCKVDFKIYWSGLVDVWFDKLIVDDEEGDKVFDPSPSVNRDSKIVEEISHFTNYATNITFFADEVKYSNYECIKHVISVMKGSNPNAELVCIANPSFQLIGKRDISEGIFKPFFDVTNWKRVIVDPYQFYAENKNMPDNFTGYDGRIPYDDWKANKTEYNNWLQNKTFGRRDNKEPNNTYYGSYTYIINKLRTDINNLTYKPELIIVPQLHSDLAIVNDKYINGKPLQHYSGGSREPTNEEIEAQAMIAITHGVDHLGWFVYSSAEWSYPNGTSECYNGLLNKDNSRRTINMYNKNKWQFIGLMNQKILNIKPYLDNANWTEAYSVHAEGANHEYINDIQSLYRDATGNFVSSDPVAERYWEMGFFDPINQVNNHTKYLMMVNRRCYPEISNYDGDYRYLKIKFNTTELPHFNNWIITDVNTNESITVAVNTGDFVDLGAGLSTFQPGEGKLFKFAPIMQEGGTLVCDENVSDVTFTCNDMVYSYGKNITIGNRTSITFKPVAGIHMYNADFNCSYTDGPGNNYINFMPETGSSWQGISFEYGNVNIQNAVIQNNNNVNNQFNYTISGNLCASTNISNCLFNLTGNARAISFSNNINGDGDNVYNDYLMNNIINAYGTNIPVVEYQSTAESINTIMMDGNYINCQENSGGTAVSLLCYNGVIKNNVISSFNTGVQLNFSSMSFLNNTIQNYGNGQNAVLADALSFIAMGKNGNTLTGGYNSLNISGSETKILDLSNSSFDIGYGSNDFNLSDNASYDIYGYSPLNNDAPEEIDASGNCFYYNTYIYSNMDYTNGQGGAQYTFTFDPPTACVAQNPLAIDFVVNLDNGRNDTVYKLSNAPQENLSTAEQLIKKVNTDFRKAEFEDVKQNCEQLLTNYTDSIAVIDIIAKLYASTVNLDTNGQLTQNLKTLLEQIILQHPDKIDLIKCAFYYIQKCKVVNEDYLSALQGFQQIMQQNPYDYLGLVASWDYASTMLLMDTTGGTGGSESEQFMMSEEGYIRNLENYFEHYDSFGYDSLKFSKEDRKKIKEALIKTFSDTRKQQTTKFDEVKKLSEKGDEKAKVQVTKMKTLNETVKIKKPKNHLELSKMIHSDVAKVFGNSNSGKGKSNFDLIPDSYSLSQNYPNPFNPNTKINYDLPKDGRVKLVIYDILGRQIKSLVNNEFKTAGRYTVEFNGTQYASGVYFYRIQVEDGKGFTAVKKMVLVK